MRLILLTVLAVAAGCASQPEPTPKYYPVPEGYLLPCELPLIPITNAELADAFLQAYACAVDGNEDKAKIRALGDVDVAD